MPTVADVSTVPYSGDLRVDSLLHLSAGWNYLLPARTTLYFTFDLGAIGGESPQGRPVAVFNDLQQAAARAILAHASAVTGVQFAEVAGSAQADIHFANCDLDSSGLCSTEWSYSYGADNVLTAYRAEAYVFLDSLEFAASNGSPLPGSAGYEVLLHEIGHALGLDHPFDEPYPLPAALDNTGNTVMSYTHVGGSKSTFQGHDLLALAWIYGADGLGGALGLNSTRGPLLDDYAATAATPGSLAVGSTLRGTVEQALDRDWLAVELQADSSYLFELRGAAGGVGTLADPLLRLLSPAGAVLASNDNAGGIADSRLEFIVPASGRYFLEVASAVANGTGTWQLSAAPVLDQISGTAGDDTLVDATVGAARLYGLAGNDRLQGGAGDDLLDGGGGIDTASYARGTGSYVVTRTADPWRVADKTGAEGTDTLVSIEKLQFGDKTFDLVNPPRSATPAYNTNGSTTPSWCRRRTSTPPCSTTSPPARRRARRRTRGATRPGTRTAGRT